jgi:uncharacterized SAM-binding protein YcdF (DUF218 family)
LCGSALVFFPAWFVLGFTPAGKWLGGEMAQTPTAAQLTPADAIVILGGEPSRAVAAAQLYRKGLARRQIVSADSVRMLQTLEVCGIDPAAVEIEDLARTTADHPRTIQTLPGISPRSSLILVTSGFHPARVQMIFRRAGYTRFQIYSNSSRWWKLQKKPYIGAVQGIKLMYELLAYAKDRVL